LIIPNSGILFILWFQERGVESMYGNDSSSVLGLFLLLDVCYVKKIVYTIPTIILITLDLEQAIKDAA